MQMALITMADYYPQPLLGADQQRQERLLCSKFNCFSLQAEEGKSFLSQCWSPTNIYYQFFILPGQ